MAGSGQRDLLADAGHPTADTTSAVRLTPRRATCIGASSRPYFTTPTCPDGRLQPRERRDVAAQPFARFSFSKQQLHGPGEPGSSPDDGDLALPFAYVILCTERREVKSSPFRPRRTTADRAAPRVTDAPCETPNRRLHKPASEDVPRPPLVERLND